MNIWLRTNSRRSLALNRFLSVFANFRTLTTSTGLWKPPIHLCGLHPAAYTDHLGYNCFHASHQISNTEWLGLIYDFCFGVILKDMCQSMIHHVACDRCYGYFSVRSSNQIEQNAKIRSSLFEPTYESASNQMPIKPTAIFGLNVNISLLVDIWLGEWVCLRTRNSRRSFRLLTCHIQLPSTEDIQFHKMFHNTFASGSNTGILFPSVFITAIMPIIISCRCRLCDSWKITWNFAMCTPHRTR